MGEMGWWSTNQTKMRIWAEDADMGGGCEYKGVSGLALEPTSILLPSKHIFYSMRNER